MSCHLLLSSGRNQTVSNTAAYCNWPPRLPAPGKAGVATTFADHPNSHGFCRPIGVDLQRIFACIHVTGEENTWDFRYLSQVATSTDSFSTKVVMPMSAQQEWRPVCGPVLHCPICHTESSYTQVESYSHHTVIVIVIEAHRHSSHTYHMWIFGVCYSRGHGHMVTWRFIDSCVF